MASVEEKEECKKFALNNSGRSFLFHDGGPMAPLLKGRVVGYYFTFAFLVMETTEKPLNDIDPIMGSLSSNGALLIRGSHYTLCNLNDIVFEEQKNLDFPHKCPKCNKNALIMFRTVDCSNISCQNYCRR